MDCFLTILTVSVIEQTFLIVKKSNLLIFFFLLLVFYLKTHFKTQGHLDFFPVLPSRSFVVFHFTLGLWSIFELIFVKSIRTLSRLTFFACGCPVVPALFGGRLSILHCIIWASLSKINWFYLCESISECCVLFHWSICLFLCQFHSLDYCRFIVNFEIE